MVTLCPFPKESQWEKKSKTRLEIKLEAPLFDSQIQSTSQSPNTTSAVISHSLAKNLVFSTLSIVTNAGLVVTMYSFQDSFLNSSLVFLSVIVYFTTFSSLFFSLTAACQYFFKQNLPREGFLSILFTFTQFFLTLSLSAAFMYSIVYIPMLHYSAPKNFFVIIGTTLIYSGIATFFMQQFKNIKEKSVKFDDDRSEKFILLVIALLFGPGLIYVMLQNIYWPNPVKIQLSVVSYVSLLYLFFSIYDYFVGNSIRLIIGRRPNPSIPIEFVKFYLTFLSAAFCMYTFVYIPVLHYQTPKNYVVIFVTTCLYSFLAAAIFYRFRQLKNIALRSKVAQAEAQYSLLESQMQPHFLFNSLNVLSELIYVDPDLANSMAQKMADLYREVLNNSKNNFSNLESEISILKKYIEIQKIRFGDRINFTADVSPAYYNLQIPSLMLQTLVENAIKHGISPKQEGGVINLSVAKEGNMFEVCIANTGALYKGHSDSKRSTGLQNTKNRLELAYGSKNSFRIYSDEKRTYVKFLITGRTS